MGTEHPLWREAWQYAGRHGSGAFSDTLRGLMRLTYDLNDLCVGNVLGQDNYQ